MSDQQDLGRRAVAKKHAGPWGYYDADYPDEGTCGPFATLAEARAHAADIYPGAEDKCGEAVFVPLTWAQAAALEAAP